LDVVVQGLEALGLRPEGRMEPPHHTPCDSRFVQTLLRAYEQYTGNEGVCKAVGGWSYVHNIEGGVCFGACMPGFEPNWHGANECMPIKDLIVASKIFAQAIIDLTLQSVIH
jgi:succinyl-diaminopimelate desuccinylase